MKTIEGRVKYLLEATVIFLTSECHNKTFGDTRNCNNILALFGMYLYFYHVLAIVAHKMNSFKRSVTTGRKALTFSVRL